MSHSRRSQGKTRLEWRLRSFKPQLERIEDRLLPGETVGMLLWQGNLMPESANSAEVRADTTAISGSASQSEHFVGAVNQTAALPSAAEAYPERSAAPALAENHAAARQGSGDSLMEIGLQDNQPPNAFHSTASLASALATLPRQAFQADVAEPRTALQAAGQPSSQPLTVGADSRHDNLGLLPASLKSQKVGTLGTVGLPWSSYGHDAQHSGISDNPSVPLTQILWQTPVDLRIPSGDIFIHYASPVITANNTVIVAVKTGTAGNFIVEGHDGFTGNLKWSVNTDYVITNHGWIPALPDTLGPDGTFYFAGAGGKIYSISNPDDNGATITDTEAFYGIQNYTSSLNSRIYIDTPLTADSQGNVFFGEEVTAPALGIQSGIARQAPDGTGAWTSASAAAADGGIRNVAQSSAPALSLDGSNVYVAVTDSTGGGGTGYLARLDSATLAPLSRVHLNDPSSGRSADISGSSTSSPMVGPDGDVYFGVLENPFPANNDRGWELHFSSDLSQQKTPGAFGWDDTPSVVPSSLVPSYTGSSSYLIMSKYNNYAGINSGDGVNKVGILDPNDTMRDPITGATVMRDVLTVVGPTPDPNYRPRYPNAVREWCINAAAIDPFNGSVLVNSEDGALYRWDLNSNALTEGVQLAPPRGEAYTSTAIGPDGTTYAINNGILFAVG